MASRLWAHADKGTPPVTMLRRFVPLSLLALATLHAADYPEPKWLGDHPEEFGKNVQRTMRLLAESTPGHRHTVKILFYGQSITEQGWWKIVADDLRKRYPDANLLIENRAIGGHSSQLLVKTAEADLYPWQPDLVIFHVYGAHDKYADIIRSIRERTTAEILQQNDHVTKPEHLTEPMDASQLAPGKGPWDSFMNFAWLPSLSQKYGTEFCDQRAVWKHYLADWKLEPKSLLKDSVHLNPHGEYLMAEAVKSHLRRNPAFDPAPAESWIKTFTVGTDATWKEGKLTFEFDGARIDAIPGASGSAEVRIDGKKPAELGECHTFTRISSYPGSNWPILLRVQSNAAQIEEDWTLALNDVGGDVANITFKLFGSVTGPDGAGKAGEPFISKSGRVKISPEDWNLEFCYKVFGRKLKEGDMVTWKSRLMGKATISGGMVSIPGVEPIVTLAQGLKNGRHTLELTGDASSVAGLRVYTPPAR